MVTLSIPHFPSQLGSCGTTPTSQTFQQSPSPHTPHQKDPLPLSSPPQARGSCPPSQRKTPTGGTPTWCKREQAGPSPGSVLGCPSQGGGPSWGRGQWRTTAVSQCSCVTASFPTAPVTSGVGLHPSLTRVSPLASPLPLLRQGREDWASGGTQTFSFVLLPTPNSQCVPGCLPQRPLPACLWLACPWEVLTPGSSLGRGSQHGLAHPQDPPPSLYSAPGPSPKQTLQTPARTLPPSNLAVGDLAVCPGSLLKPPPFSEQMNMPSWAPSSSRRWYESSWAKG